MVGLLQNDPAGRPLPGIATSWENSPDGLVWTFHLRDALWSDGRPVTAEDFVFGMQRVLDPKMASENAALLYFIKGAEAVNDGKAPPSALGVRALDPHTLRIELIHPAPYLLELARHTVMMPTPRQAIAKWGDAWAQPGRYVSDGPFVLTEWKQNDHVTVVKNPRFFDSASVCPDRVVYYPTVDYLSAERRVRRGELDMQDGIDNNRIPFLRQPDQIPAYVHVKTYLGVEYYVFNTRSAPALRDKRVRQALTMDIDRDFITHKLTHDVWQAADTFVPPGVENYAGAPAPYWANWSFAKRQAHARRLMQAAGFSPGRPLHLQLLIRSTAGSPMLSALVQSDWKAIGVQLEIVNNDAAVAYAEVRAGDFQVFQGGWIADYDDPMSFLFLMRSDTGAWNYAGYANPRYDDLLNKADAEPNAAKRAAYLSEAERIMLEDAPVAPLWFESTQNLVSPRVTGWADNIMDYHPERYMCIVGASARVRPGDR